MSEHETHRNLKTGSRIKPWKVKTGGGKVPKVGAHPKQYIHT
jgi:hypothetical protein